MSACLLLPVQYHEKFEIASPDSGEPKQLVSIHTEREIEFDSEDR